MKFCLLSFLLLAETSLAFFTPSKISTAPKTSSPIAPSTTIRSSIKDETKTKVDAAVEQNGQPETDPDSEGLPWWWDLVWKLDIMEKGEPDNDIIFGDSANVLRTNIEQIYGGYPSLDGCPLAEGELGDIAGGTMFIGLQTFHKKYGSPFKLCFGPKSFLVISDPVQARYLLRDASKTYDKVSKDFSFINHP